MSRVDSLAIDAAHASQSPIHTRLVIDVCKMPSKGGQMRTFSVRVTSIKRHSIRAIHSRVEVALHLIDRFRDKVQSKFLVTKQVVQKTPRIVGAIGKGTMGWICSAVDS